MPKKHPSKPGRKKAASKSTLAPYKPSKDLCAQIEQTDDEIIAQLEELITQHDRHQWVIGDLLIILVERGWTNLKLAKRLKYDEATLSQWRLTAHVYPMGKRNFQYPFLKHNLARMGANTVARDRHTEPDYDDAIAIVGPKKVRTAKDASKAIRAERPHKWDLGEPEKPRPGLDQIVCGDALEETTKIADKVEAGELDPFHLVLFSPPYFHKKLYEEYGPEIHRFKDYDDWLDYQHKLAEQFRRLLHPHGIVAPNIDDCTVEWALKKEGAIMRYPVLADFDFVYRRQLGYSYRDRYVWAKQECVADHHMIGGPRSPRVNNAFEDIPIYQKSTGLLDMDRTSIGDEERKAWLTGGVWSIQTVSRNKSPCPYPYPEELAYRLIALYTGVGQNVFAPFVGSGTDAIAAKKLNRHFIGIEADKTTAAYAQKQLAATKVGDPIKRGVPTLLGLPVDPEMKILIEQGKKKRKS